DHALAFFPDHEKFSAGWYRRASCAEPASSLARKRSGHMAGGSQMSVSPEALYFELGSLATEMPDLATGPITSEKKDWIERAAGLLHLTGGLAEKIQFTTAVENLYGELQMRNAETITAIVQNALIKAEDGAPAWLQGTFLIAGNSSEAFAAMRAVLAT